MSGIKTTKLASTIGAEVEGLDAAAMTPADAKAIRDALWTHRFLVFRGLDLSPSDQVQVMSSFGNIAIETDDEESRSSPEKLHGKVSYVTTRPSEYLTGRGMFPFHSDFQFFADGAGDAFSLHAILVEDESPTIFADMVAAVKRMPKDLVDELRALNVVQCAHLAHDQKPFGLRYRMSQRDPSIDYGNTASIHPAIGRHRITGEEIININETFSSHFQGWSEEDSDRLFAEAAKYQYDPEHLHRHRWRTGDLIIWDNIALQHSRDPLTGSFTRHLQRVVSNPWSWAELDDRTGVAMAGKSLA